MWEWLTVMALLLGSLFAEGFRLRGGMPGVGGLALSGAVCGILHLVLTALCPPAAFLSALLAGQAAFLGLEVRRHGDCPAAACLFFGWDLASVPIGLSGEDVWESGVFLAALAMCASLAAANSDRGSRYGLETNLETLEGRAKLAVRLMPGVMVVPAGIALTAAAFSGGFTPLTGLLSSAGLLAVYALVLAFQGELAARLELSAVSVAIGRWQRESRDYINTIRAQRHDLNLHLNAISGLLKSGSFDKCQNYVNKMVAEVNAINDIMPVGDPVVGSLLLNMREQARRHGSDITYHITHDMADTVCNGFECNKIIGNLLQNAIDAFESQEDRVRGIDLYIFKRRGNTVIAAENRFTGDKDRVARMFELGWSSKRGHEGLGLAMVLRTVEKYGGKAYPFFKGDTIRIIVNIPNKIHLTGEEDADEYSYIDT